MGIFPWLLLYAAGLCVAPHLPFSAVPSWATAFAFILLWLLRANLRFFHFFAGLFFVMAGILSYSLAVSPPADPSHLFHQLDAAIVPLHGKVLDVVHYPDGRGRVDLDVLSRNRDEGVQVVRGRMRLFFGDRGADGHHVQPGDHVRLRTRLRHPEPFGTPGEFNYQRYLAARHIHVTGYVKSLDEVAVFPESVAWYSADYLKRMRLKIANAITQDAVPGSILTKALLIGDKSGLSPGQREILARGGISHLFSISGLHLSLVACYGYHLLLLYWRRNERLMLELPPRRYLPLALIPLLLIYLGVTGGALPTMRAFFMASVGALLWLYCWRTRPLNLVWTAAFLFLLAQPLLIFDVSFQLSFVAVTAIVACVARWSLFCQGYPLIMRWFCLLGLTTLAATLATLPLTLLHFHLFAPAGLLTNFVAVPAIALVALPLGLAAMALLPLWPAAAQTLFSFVHLIVRAVEQVTAFIVDLPLLGGWRVFLSPGQLLSVSLLIFFLMLLGHTRTVLSWRVLVPAGCIFFLLLGLSPTGDSGRLQVTAISVGQGDATLVSLGDHRHILIDGGGLYSDTFDVGERLVAPALGYLGVSSLAAVVLTHDHPDHRKGLKFILEHFDVGQFWASRSFDLSTSPLGEVLEQRDLPVRYFDAGWNPVEGFSPFELNVYQPKWNTGNENDHSLVVHAGLDEHGVLLTGDLEHAGISQLMLHPLPGAVCLLKMPHHGSAGSQPEELLDYVRPELALASAGRNNVHGLPAARVVEALKSRGIALFRTDTQGSLRWSTDGGSHRMEVWSRGRFSVP